MRKIHMSTAALIGIGIFWCALGYAIYANVLAYNSFNQRKQYVSRDTFFDGVSVDRRELSGMTFSEATSVFAAENQRDLTKNAITLKLGDTDQNLTNAQCGYTTDYESVLNQAFAVGRFGSLEERYAQIHAVETNGAAFIVSRDFNEQQIAATVMDLAQEFDHPAKDARLGGFDFVKKTFSITSEVTGTQIDQVSTAEKIHDAVNSDTISLAASMINIPALITRVDLNARVGLVGEATTTTTSDAARNANIAIAQKAVYGRIIAPGEIFSFNQATGQRTTAKGYKPAGAIVNGVLVSEPGGGVCQVSSTLFNALAKADLEIVERHPHSWPSTYIKIGLDAAVDWGSADLRVKNTSEMPIYVWSSFKDRTLTIEIYGAQLSGGRTVMLSSAVTSTTPPGSETLRKNPQLSPGEKTLLSPARTGYTATTYREYFFSGKLQKKVELFKSAYPARGAIYEAA